MNAGLPSLIVDSNYLTSKNIPFAVAIKDDEVIAFIVSRENWLKVEKLLNEHLAVMKTLPSAKPLVSVTPTLDDTIREWGWITVGSP